MSLSLPALSDFEAFQTWRADASRWLPVALEIAHGHGLRTAAPHVFTTGTNLVVGLGDELILKLFPPIHRAQFVSERASLTQLQGRLSIPIPDLLFEGERCGWPYLVITRLHGAVGSEVWPALPEDQKERVLLQIGATIAEVQRAPLGELSRIKPGWKQFMSAQIEGCRARHTRLGLPQKFLDGFDDILRDAAPLIPMDRPVILTGEYIPENFLLTRDGNKWRLSGLFDFGDVMTGFGEYDLLGPSAFMTAGMKRRVRSLFEGFGYSDADINPAMKRRLMALMLLHRVSDPIRHIQIEGWQEKAGDLVELQELLWPT
ncbi:MAG: aminoglycoside phosphotransferase family protein [Bradyrhizobium sp.]